MAVGSPSELAPAKLPKELLLLRFPNIARDLALPIMPMPSETDTPAELTAKWRALEPVITTQGSLAIRTGTYRAGSAGEVDLHALESAEAETVAAMFAASYACLARLDAKIEAARQAVKDACEQPTALRLGVSGRSPGQHGSS